MDQEVQGSAHEEDCMVSSPSRPSKVKFPVLKLFVHFVIDICVRGCGSVLFFFVFITVLRIVELVY